jgi:hypothetical protein
VLFVGDDWAEAHHNIEIENDEGRVVVRRRLPGGRRVPFSQGDVHLNCQIVETPR